VTVQNISQMFRFILNNCAFSHSHVTEQDQTRHIFEC